VKTENAEDITAKAQALAQAAMKLGEAMYKAQAGGPEGAAPGGEASSGASGDDVVDADFTEVDENKKRGQG
jgi:molecular chaperone DnaK